MNQTIDKVLKAQSVTDLWPDLNLWKQGYRDLASVLHPDVCKEPGAPDAMAKLNQYKADLETGKKHKDDAGEVIYNFTHCKIKGDNTLLKQSYDNYKYLMSLKDEASKNFQNYLPLDAELKDGELIFSLPYRAIPLSSLGEVEQKHVNWIASRMFEFSAWINQIGYVHLGINPESIYVMPENHGIIVTSFYHMTKIDQKVTTISGRYKQFYPAKLFSEKIATTNIDTDLAKRTAIYLLGDKSGSGTRLRKTHNEDILNFFQKEEIDPKKNFVSYRELLKKHFKSEFHIFNV